MQRSLNLLLMAIILFLPAKVYSLETVRVLVLPFEIHSQQELSYLKTEIQGIFKNHFKQNGAIVIEADSSLENQTKSIAGMRNLGIKSGADYVVWGSLTWLEQKFSIDAKMIESFNNKPPNILFVEGEGIENLFGSVKKLAENLGIRLFRLGKVAKVLVEGNKRIETDAIKKYIKTKPGDIFNTKNISEDLKSVYSMGYFEDIRIKSEDKPEGKTIIFIVKEKPTIRLINLKGNTVYDDEEIKEYLNIRTGSILNIFKINSNIRRIEELYKEKNYHNIKVDYDLKQLENNQADLEFIIEEGEKVQIKKIIFEGNNAFDSDKLKGLMKTSEKGFFSWLTSSGELNIEDLNQDIARLSAFYHNNGYIQAR
ncbi:MAG: outer membrane protein assembly factor BamA, partial [Desulfobacterales bacterium]|nr:outer membrane protein assembly factor BamA [Desulfobacterales bacterium]